MSHISANKFMSRLQQCYEKYRTNYPPKAKTEGCLSYMNGNDSTPFDYKANGRLCEFGDFYTENQQKGLYYIKIFVNKDGSVDVYVYRESQEQLPYQCTEYTEYIYSEEDVAYIAGYLTENADKKCLLNKSVNGINWDA